MIRKLIESPCNNSQLLQFFGDHRKDKSILTIADIVSLSLTTGTSDVELEQEKDSEDEKSKDENAGENDQNEMKAVQIEEEEYSSASDDPQLSPAEIKQLNMVSNTRPSFSLLNVYFLGVGNCHSKLAE